MTYTKENQNAKFSSRCNDWVVFYKVAFVY